MKVPLFDLKLQYKALKPEIDKAIEGVFEHTQFIMGPEVKLLEAKLAEYCNTKYAVGVSSGTDALIIALHALGIKPGDEVIVPTFSFFASAGVVARLGATPVFVDIDERTFNINANQIEQKILQGQKL
jgi:dTDP-4-amino-4,6-dideoxygalactose transaminase